MVVFHVSWCNGHRITISCRAGTYRDTVTINWTSLIKPFMLGGVLVHYFAMPAIDTPGAVPSTRVPEILQVKIHEFRALAT